MSSDEVDIDFTVFVNLPACSIVQNLDYKDRCMYVRDSKECKKINSVVNYVYLLYCHFNPQNIYTEIICVLALLSLCLIMFIILGITANKFFCPALKVMSKVFGMSEHLAGVTVLAFGNGSPDLFTSIAAWRDHNRMMYSDLFGAAVYVLSFVGGILCIIEPFKLHGYNILRDMLFFIFGVLYIEYAVTSDNYVTIIEAISIILIYVIYLVVTIMDQFLLTVTVKRLEARYQYSKYVSDEEYAKLYNMRDQASIDVLARVSRLSIDINKTRKMSYNANAHKNDGLFLQLILSLNPFDMARWEENDWIVRFFVIVEMPVTFVLQLLMPVIDYELKSHGWSKLLNCIQLNTMPAVIGYLLFGEYIVFIFIITVPASIYLFSISRTDLPPRYHSIFAIYSALASMYIIYSCAFETVSILNVVGIVTHASNSFLGCTILAWGNAIGDIVSNIALAKDGYHKMGYAACHGGPFFNSLLAMGTTFLIKCCATKTGRIMINQGQLGDNCYIFLLILLIMTIVWNLCTNFVVRRSIGIFHIILYFIFFLYALLGEIELIQTFTSGTETGVKPM